MKGKIAMGSFVDVFMDFLLRQQSTAIFKSKFVIVFEELKFSFIKNDEIFYIVPELCVISFILETCYTLNIIFKVKI